MPSAGRARRESVKPAVARAIRESVKPAEAKFNETVQELAVGKI